MRSILALLTFILFLSSANAISNPPNNKKSIRKTETAPTITFQNSLDYIEKTTGHKLSFIERIVVKTAWKKYKRKLAKSLSEETEADRQARSAETFGIISLVSLFLFPLAAIPLAIIAISKADIAKRLGTSIPKRARTGKTLGIVTLCLLIIPILVFLLFLSLYTR